MAKKKGLPEISVTAQSHSGLVDLAKQAHSIRSQISELVAREENLKEQIAEAAYFIRKAEEQKSNYVGLIKVVDGESSPSQIQFKICNGSLDESDGPALDHFFGSARPMLYEKDVVVTGITNPDGLIAEIQGRNQNPWDYLELKVKKGLDRAFVDSSHITLDKAFMPVEGFLATLNEVKHTLNNKAKEFIANYLERVLKPTVSLGHK